MLKEEVFDVLQKNGFFYDTLESVSTKELKSRKKIECFFGLQKDEYFVLFCSTARSRVLKGEFEKLETLSTSMASLKNVKLQNKIYCSSAPFCSKALQYAQDLGWRVFHVPL